MRRAWQAIALAAAAAACGHHGTAGGEDQRPDEERPPIAVPPAPPTPAPVPAPAVIPTPEPVAEPTELPRDGEDAILSHGEVFRIRPHDDAPSFRASLEDGTIADAEEAATARVVRVLSSKNGWVEVENPGSAELKGHCLGALEEIEPFRLHFWVRASALGHVLARRYTEKYPDGTRIDLLPGLPLGAPDANGRVHGAREQVLLDLALPPDAVALSYEAPTAQVAKAFRIPRPRKARDDQPMLGPDAHLRVGPHEVVTSSSFHVWPRSSKGGKLIELADPCSRVTALAKPEDVANMVGIGGFGPEPLGAYGYASVTDHDTRYLYPKTELFWEDGTPAGEAREERSYDFWHRHPKKPELVCIVHDLVKPSDTSGPNQKDAQGAGPATQLTLCFRYADSNHRDE